MSRSGWGKFPDQMRNAVNSDPNLGTSQSSDDTPSSSNGHNLSGNDKRTPYQKEVHRALYGDTTGHPPHGSDDYYKAAEDYALYGESFLDFPADLSQCFSRFPMSSQSSASSVTTDETDEPAAAAAQPQSSGNAAASTVALFDRKITGAVFPTSKAVPTSSSALANLIPSFGNLRLASHKQQPPQPKQPEQQLQQRQAVGAENTAISLSGPAASNPYIAADFAQLYHQLLASRLHQAQNPAAGAALLAVSGQQAEQQLLVLQQQLQCSLELQQQIQLRQLQLQQRQQQQQPQQLLQQLQQLQLPRVPRPLYGGNAVAATTDAGDGAAASAPKEQTPAKK